MSGQTTIKTKFDRLQLFMDEKMRRLWAANESLDLGFGGVSLVSAATGLSHKTIYAGRAELKQLETSRRPAKIQTLSRRIRRPGAGRKLVETKYPEIIAALERLLKDEIAGDPMSEQRWVRSSLRRLSKSLKIEGYPASAGVVRRLLKNMGFSPKANKRKHGRHGCPERDTQFKHIASTREQFVAAGLPVISVDTKKKELIGEFRNPGWTWRRQSEEVHEHDFPDSAECRAVPLGIYDIAKNAGYVYVGVSNDTPEFAACCIAEWWKKEGSRLYTAATKLLILADGGGCNGCRARAWKLNLQEKISDALGLTVTVCHYPTGCSKWNPVEHRLFSYISMNWAGKPLKTLGIMLGYIRGTTTEKGLTVKAFLDEGFYKRAQKVSRDEMARLKLTNEDVCPQWNYTIRPRTKSPKPIDK
jgi:Rhodopirellula transposase DDE domain